VQFLILLLYWKSGLPPIVQAQATVQNTNQQEIFKKYWSLSGRYTNIAADTDMHTIIQSGNYGCGNETVSSFV